MKKGLKYDFTLIFGKKGSGKTSFLAKMAKRYSKDYTVYCTEKNIVGTYYLPLEKVGEVWLEENSILLIDELSIAYNSRSFKNTSQKVLQWFKMQRHNKVKVYAFTQVYDDSDKQIRNLADNMYVAKNMGFFSVYRRIKKVLGLQTNNQGYGEIIDSYEYASIFQKGSLMFCSLKKYRKYFDSYSRLDVPDIDTKSLIYTGLPDASEGSIINKYVSKIPFLKQKVDVTKV